MNFLFVWSVISRTGEKIAYKIGTPCTFGSPIPHYAYNADKNFEVMQIRMILLGTNIELLNPKFLSG